MKKNTRAAFIRHMLENERVHRAVARIQLQGPDQKPAGLRRACTSRSIDDPEAFWAQMAAEHLDWFKPWDAVEEYDFDVGEPLRALLPRRAS